MIENYFIKNEQSLIKEFENSEYKYTSNALFNFYLKSKSIDNIIQSINPEIDYYPCFILLRSQIEHFIVATYLWVQFRITENDETSKIYCEDYMLYEVIKRLNYSKSNNINMTSRISIAFRKLLDILTENEIVEQKEFEELNRKGNQFDIKKISKFLDNNLPFDFDNIIKPEKIKQLLENYNYFSSFVHGGSTADAILNEKSKIEIATYIKEMKEWSSNILSVLQVYIIYFLAMNDKKFEYLLIKGINKKTGV